MSRRSLKGRRHPPPAHHPPLHQHSRHPIAEKQSKTTPLNCRNCADPELEKNWNSAEVSKNANWLRFHAKAPVCLCTRGFLDENGHRNLNYVEQKIKVQWGQFRQNEHKCEPLLVYYEVTIGLVERAWGYVLKVEYLQLESTRGEHPRGLWFFILFQNMVACPRWNCTFGEDYLVYLSRPFGRQNWPFPLLGLCDILESKPLYGIFFLFIFISSKKKKTLSKKGVVNLREISNFIKILNVKPLHPTK